jgi:hypothetical protein
MESSCNALVVVVAAMLVGACGESSASTAPDPARADAGDASSDAANLGNFFVDELPNPTGGCLPRSLSVDASGRIPCFMVEAVRGTCSCDSASGRAAVSDALDAAIRRQMERTSACGGTTGVVCSDFCLCMIVQLEGAALTTCQTDVSAIGPPGFCYVDPAQDAGTADLVAACPETEKRELRVLGGETPATGALIFLACGSGA